MRWVWSASGPRAHGFIVATSHPIKVPHGLTVAGLEPECFRIMSGGRERRACAYGCAYNLVSHKASFTAVCCSAKVPGLQAFSACVNALQLVWPDF
ncbi:MAG: hypothetical protein JWO37_965 [Acidimicrobiales bacterium]|nr:hypothetical protein [Acidimicrobiales bacterium]